MWVVGLEEVEGSLGPSAVSAGELWILAGCDDLGWRWVRRGVGSGRGGEVRGAKSSCQVVVDLGRPVKVNLTSCSDLEPRQGYTTNTFAFTPLTILTSDIMEGLRQ